MRRTTTAVIALLAVVLVAVVLVWWFTRDRGLETGTRNYGEASSTKALPAPSASPADDGNWTMPG